MIRALCWTACFALALLSCSAGNVCDQAAELCGKSADTAGSCAGEAKQYASCLVEADSCSPAVLAECAKGQLPVNTSGAFNNNNSNSSNSSNAANSQNTTTKTGIELRAHAYVRKPSTEIVWVPITLYNHDEDEPLGTAAVLFSVETDRATVVVPVADAELTRRPCDGEIKIAPGGKLTCQLIVELPTALQPVRVRYRDPRGRSAQADLPEQACSWLERESTAAACNDGCDNDGNSFFDCSDLACCSYRSGCPEYTVCGQKEAEFCLAEGPETTLAACSDGCDNDHNLFTDCNDRNCCDARLDCPADTYCGKQ